MHYEKEWDSQREKRTEEAEGTPAHHSAFIPVPLLTAGCSDSRIRQNTFGWFLHLNFGLSCFSSFRYFFFTRDWTDSLLRGQDAFITGMSHPASMQYKRLFALVISTVVDVHFTPGSRYLSWSVCSQESMSAGESLHPNQPHWHYKRTFGEHFLFPYSLVGVFFFTHWKGA